MPSKAKLQIVEIDKEDTKPLGSIKECQAAILSLRSHLGFEELLRRMRVARAMLRSRHESCDDAKEARNLRALIQAYSFVERQLKQETGRPLPAEPRSPFEEEQAEYDRISQALSLVGGSRPS